MTPITWFGVFAFISVPAWKNMLWPSTTKALKMRLLTIWMRMPCEPRPAALEDRLGIGADQRFGLRVADDAGGIGRGGGDKYGGKSADETRAKPWRGFERGIEPEEAWPG